MVGHEPSGCGMVKLAPSGPSGDGDVEELSAPTNGSRSVLNPLASLPLFTHSDWIISNWSRMLALKALNSSPRRCPSSAARSRYGPYGAERRMMRWFAGSTTESTASESRGLTRRMCARRGTRSPSRSPPFAVADAGPPSCADVGPHGAR